MCVCVCVCVCVLRNVTAGIKIDEHSLGAILYADNHATLTDTSSQIAVNKLNNVLNEYDVTMSASKMKAMAFYGQNLSDVN